MMRRLVLSSCTVTARVPVNAFPLASTGDSITGFPIASAAVICAFAKLSVSCALT